jgi:catechol 2,3-dioxygenase-like lactoylglutathione lyase family enzyme
MKADGLFRPGDNIAMKVPSDEFAGTVRFYRDVLGLRELEKDSAGSVIFDFGGKRLWIDPMPQFSQTEVWLEVITSDLDEAARHLEAHSVTRRDDIEALPEGLAAFWVKSPAGIIHLVSEE